MGRPVAERLIFPNPYPYPQFDVFARSGRMSEVRLKATDDGGVAFCPQKDPIRVAEAGRTKIGTEMGCELRVDRLRKPVSLRTQKYADLLTGAVRQTRLSRGADFCQERSPLERTAKHGA